MINRKLTLATLVSLAGVFSAFADTAYPPAEQAAAENNSKIEKFRKDAYWKNAPFAVAAVDPQSGIRRNPALFPEDGDFTNSVKIIAAGDDYENASVLLYSFSDIDEVYITPDQFYKVGGGAVIGHENTDVKIVKVWYQQGTAWGSFFSDPLRRLPTPELMVHDESLLHVDHVAKENYVRYGEADNGKYRWVSFNGAAVDHSYDGWVDPSNIYDAPSLRPFKLFKNEFKQVMFTVRVPAGQPAGLYKGRFHVSIKGKSICDIPVQLRVLPFDLPKPAVFRDTKKPFMVSPYLRGCDLKKDESIVRNMVRHNVRNALLNPFKNIDDVRAAYDMFTKTGFDTNYLFCAIPSCGVTTSYPPNENDANFEKYCNAMIAATNVMAAIREVFGPGVKAYSYGIDEGSAWTVRAERGTWEGINRLGGHTVVATRYHPFILFNLDYANVPRHPRKSKRANADDFHAANPDGLIGWYADPHSGPENPDYTRRIYGWQSWRNNYDAACQYILYRDNWNDFWVPAESNLRGLMLVYPQSGDLIDTIEWEGLREGLDDIRYGTLLKILCEKGLKSADNDTRYAARASLTWLAQVDCEHSALDYLRLEMIRRILDMQARLAKEGK